MRERREGIVVSWYASAGTFSERRTGVSEADPDQSQTETEWTLPDQPGPVTLWSVIRDDRAGSSWTQYQIVTVTR